MFDPPLTEEQKEWGRVLQCAHAFVERNPRLSFGEAVQRAVEMADCVVPPEVQDRMLAALFNLSVNGFPSKVEA